MNIEAIVKLNNWEGFMDEIKLTPYRCGCGAYSTVGIPIFDLVDDQLMQVGVICIECTEKNNSLVNMLHKLFGLE